MGIRDEQNGWEKKKTAILYKPVIIATEMPEWSEIHEICAVELYHANINSECI